MSHHYTLGAIDETGLGYPCVARICWTLTAPSTAADQKHALIMWGEVHDSKTQQQIVGGQCIDELVRYFRTNSAAQNFARIARRWSYNHLRRGSLIQEDHLRAAAFPGYPLDFESWAKAKLQLAGLDPCPHTGHVYGVGHIHEPLPLHLIQYMTACQSEYNCNEKQYASYGV